MRPRVLARHVLLLALVTAVVLAGCSDDDSPFKPGPRPDLSRISPENTLAALRLAYEARDSIATAAIYDSAYTGQSTDLTEPPGSQILNFDYADEVGHVAALRRTSSISEVLCDFGPSLSWTRMSSDEPLHPEWAMILLAGYNIQIEITDGPTLYRAGGGSDVMAFHFSPTLDGLSPTDTLWKVVRWNEVRGATP